MQATLYEELNTNISIINYSEQRLTYLIDINLDITQMILITNTTLQRLNNPNLPNGSYTLNYNNNTLLSSFSASQSQLYTDVDRLKDSQTELSLQSTGLSASSLAEINPSNVVLDYLKMSGIDMNYTYTVWQAVMEIVVSSYRIAVMNSTQVDDTQDSTVFFVTKNSLNNVIINLDLSSGAIMNEIENTKDLNVTIFLVLLCVASFALVFSTALLIPVINKVKKNKQEVFGLFMNIKKSQANIELNKCRKFLGNFQSVQDTELIAPEGEDDKQEAGEGQDEINPKKRALGGNRELTTFRRKFKPLHLDLGVVLFKFIFLILIMEGYFIMSYFLSSTFLDRVSSLTTELNSLLSRLPTHSLLLLTEK